MIIDLNEEHLNRETEAKNEKALCSHPNNHPVKSLVMVTRMVDLDMEYDQNSGQNAPTAQDSEVMRIIPYRRVN